jgi:hypothetical protein
MIMAEDDSCVPNPTRFDALTTLLAWNLPAVSVTKDCSDLVTIVWRNPPTDDQKAKATELVGAAVHAW